MLCKMDAKKCVKLHLSSKPTTGSGDKSSDQFLDASGIKTGSPTAGSCGTPIQDLIKPKPSKTDRKKKSDTKKPHNANDKKTPDKPKPKPKDCDAIDLGLFKIQNPICSLENLLGTRVPSFRELQANEPSMLQTPDIANAPKITALP